ncbi:S1-C subfamily serine protease [Peptoniphilus olsenii]|uniref:S1-C subfamily serine protease n=1 Tax=Peptoniphilus olsenii TaxID=411570 RepID=A0ABV2JBF6_9FIRM
MYDNFKDSGNNYIYSNGENKYTKPAKKQKGKGAILVIMAIVFSLIGGVIGSMLTSMKMGKPNSTSPNNNITISAQDDMTIASAVAKKSMSSVVGITTKGVQQSFFGPVQVQGVGSGVIVDEKGYILTNAHVVKLNNQIVDKVTVRLNNETDLEGKTIWADEMIDLAIVKINSQEKLNAAVLGDSDALQIGQAAVAIGNPISLQFSQSVTQGIISGLDRYVGAVSGGGYMTGLIQTDASINGGNSGGPLLNAKGEVVGINTIKVQSAEGLGFSIPINFIKPIIKQVIETGSYKELSLGILSMDVNAARQFFGENIKSEEGIFVYKLYDKSPAVEAGLQPGDVITKIGKDKTNDNNDLKSILYKYQSGDKVNITFIRDGKEQNTELTFTDYSVEKDKNARADLQEQELRNRNQMQDSQSSERELMEEFMRRFGK